jgi:hypothetical protein
MVSCFPPCVRIPLHPLQVRSHFRSVLVAQVAVFLQPLADDLFELRRQIGLRRTAGTGSRFRMASVNQPRGVAPKRQTPVAIS